MAAPSWVKALGQTVMEAAAQSGPGQAIRDGTPGRVADQLGQWWAHLSKNAAIHWVSAFVGRQTCSFCEAEAIAACISCGDPTCIGHAFVSHRAELFCDDCVAQAMDGEGQERTPAQEAFAFFHLTKDASLTEVTAVYRDRSKKAHPDRGGSTREMQMVTRHYSVLQAHFEQREVA